VSVCVCHRSFFFFAKPRSILAILASVPLLSMSSFFYTLQESTIDIDRYDMAGFLHGEPLQTVTDDYGHYGCVGLANKAIHLDISRGARGLIQSQQSGRDICRYNVEPGTNHLSSACGCSTPKAEVSDSSETLVSLNQTRGVTTLDPISSARSCTKS
jgi:hypothetical protein